MTEPVSDIQFARNAEFAHAKARALALLQRPATSDSALSAGIDSDATLHKARDGFDPNQPRDEHGRWTDTGAGSGGGEARPAPAPAGDAHRNADQLTGAFNSRSPAGAEGSRHVVQVWELDGGGRHDAKQLGITGQSFQELSPAGAKRFHAAISAAKTGKYSAAVHVYPEEDYAGMRLFVTDDDKIGFALKGNDIVSAFKHPDTMAEGACNIMLALAVQNGGRKLDAFDTVLPTLYARNGFIAASRLAWDDEQKPPDWDYETFKKFNGGRPDVVFMVYDPERAAKKNFTYSKDDGVRAETYDQAVSIQTALMRPQDKPAPPKSTGMTNRMIQDRINEVARDMDFDPAAIMISNFEHRFELGGRQFSAAGTANISKVGKDAVLITIYADQVTPKTIDGVIAHEIEHIKFQNAINRYDNERKAVMDDPAPTREFMRPDGTLKPPYDEKYPIYTLMNEVYSRAALDFAVSDGVTNYSIDWWKQWKADQGKPVSTMGQLNRLTDTVTAMHETLAEMAMIEQQKGALPGVDDYYGYHSLAWRQGLGPGGADIDKPTKEQAQANAKIWRDLYRAIDKIWAMGGITEQSRRAA